MGRNEDILIIRGIIRGKSTAIKEMNHDELINYIKKNSYPKARH